MLDSLNAVSPSKKQIQESVEGFANRVQRVLYRWGIKKFGYDQERLKKARTHAVRLLLSYEEPNCFKAASALTLGLVSEPPFEVVLPEHFGVILKTRANALFGVLECVYWLHGAELRVKIGNGKTEARTLSHQIEFSDHFFIEFIEVAELLKWLDAPLPGGDFTPNYHSRFRILALTYEALAYQKNAHCKYPPPLALKLDEYFRTLKTED
jgi:hypothetical protein